MNRLHASTAFAILASCLVAKSQDVKSPLNLVSGQCLSVKGENELRVNVQYKGWLPPQIHFFLPNAPASDLGPPRIEGDLQDSNNQSFYKIHVEKFASVGEYRYQNEQRVYVGHGGKQPYTAKKIPAELASELQKYCFTVSK